MGQGPPCLARRRGWGPAGNDEHVDARTFLGLEPTHNPLWWRLPVTTGVSTPGNFLFGGCGLAAGIEAMESASGRPCIWATAQYLSYAPTGSEVEFEVLLARTGRQVTQ